MSHDCTVSVRFHQPPDELRRYFTTFYVTDIVAPAGRPVVDALHPEWANLRFFDGPGPDAWIDANFPLSQAQFVATGPSARSTHFRLGTTRFWGIGLMPLGWAQFVRQSAARHANLIANGREHPTFARFATLADTLFGAQPDEPAELARIIAYFRNYLDDRPPDEARILAIHAALIDPQLATVSELVERIGASQRTVERLCQRTFGFSPKLLLRRQRFMRSLAQFMLDPSLKWINAIDWHYHDQAQFVRDFHQFMGLTPREYAAQPHPVLDQFIQMRLRMTGAPVQTMDSPEGFAVRSQA